MLARRREMSVHIHTYVAFVMASSMRDVFMEMKLVCTALSAGGRLDTGARRVRATRQRPCPHYRVPS